MASCFSCGGSLDDLEGIFRSTQCPYCGKDVRVCLNCEFYDPGAHWECRETISEPVRDKDRANFCDYFTPATKRSGIAGGAGGSDKAKDDFRKLFGDE